MKHDIWNVIRVDEPLCSTKKKRNQIRFCTIFNSKIKMQFIFKCKLFSFTIDYKIFLIWKCGPSFGIFSLDHSMPMPICQRNSMPNSVNIQQNLWILNQFQTLPQTHKKYASFQKITAINLWRGLIPRIFY